MRTHSSLTSGILSDHFKRKNNLKYSRRIVINKISHLNLLILEFAKFAVHSSLTFIITMDKSQTIMIVDDDDDDIELFCEAVKEVDHNIGCICATNGEEALNKLNKEGAPLPDFIFLDLNMPRLNGKQCLRKLKNSLKLRDIPVIIYSTSKLKEDVEETKQLGAASFLTKPDKINDLRHAIASVLQGKFNLVNG